MAAIYKAGVVTTVPHYNIGSGRDAVNVIHWQTAVTGLTGAQLSAMRAAFDTAWSAAWSNLADTGSTYLGCWVIDMSSNTGFQVTNSGYTPHPGAALGVAVGDQVAALLSLKEAMRYRGGHARIYLPGIAAGVTQSDGRTMTPAGIASIDGLWTNTVTAMAGISPTNGGPLTPIIWHKKLATGVNTVTPVVNHISQPILATQRRRLRKVSRHKKKVTTP